MNPMTFEVGTTGNASLRDLKVLSLNPLPTQAAYHAGLKGARSPILRHL